MALESQDSCWSHAVLQRRTIRMFSMSPSSSSFVATVAPGWVVKRRFWFGIAFPAGGSFAFPRETQALFPSGRASSPSTRAVPQRSSRVLVDRTPGASFLLRALEAASFSSAFAPTGWARQPQMAISRETARGTGRPTVTLRQGCRRAHRLTPIRSPTGSRPRNPSPTRRRRRPPASGHTARRLRRSR